MATRPRSLTLTPVDGPGPDEPYYRRTPSSDELLPWGRFAFTSPGPGDLVIGFPYDAGPSGHAETDGRLLIAHGGKAREVALKRHQISKGLRHAPAHGFAPDGKALVVVADTTLVRVTLPGLAATPIHACGEYGAWSLDVAADGRVVYVNREGLHVVAPGTTPRVTHLALDEPTGVRLLLGDRLVAALDDKQVRLFALDGVTLVPRGALRKRLEPEDLSSSGERIFVWRPRLAELTGLTL